MFLGAQVRRLADRLIMLLAASANALPAETRVLELRPIPRLPDITLGKVPNEPPWVRLQRGSSYKRRRPPRSLGPRINSTHNRR